MIKFVSISAALLTCTLLIGCDVEKTQEGELPNVDVDVDSEGGQMPKYDVETPEVDVGTEKETVTVPDVDVTMPDENDQNSPQ